MINYPQPVKRKKESFPMDKPFLKRLRRIDPYVPGEQPQSDDIIKLNAN